MDYAQQKTTPQGTRERMDGRITGDNGGIKK